MFCILEMQNTGKDFILNFDNIMLIKLFKGWVERRQIELIKEQQGFDLAKNMRDSIWVDFTKLKQPKWLAFICRLLNKCN